MAEDPAVSVVMGVYNGASRLEETIGSVLAQTFDDFEYLIVNDGSTDPAVAAIIARYAATDPRIRLVDKQNEGLTRALADGCDAARGDFIARVDVGDTMTSERLAEQRRVLAENDGCDLVASAVSFHGPAWEPMWLNPGGPITDQPVRAVADSETEGPVLVIPHHGAAMFRKSAYLRVGGYRSEFYYGQDWDLWYRLMERGEVFVIPQTLYRARFFPDAISMANSHRQRAIAALSLEGHRLRTRGQDEQRVLAEAAAIRPEPGEEKGELATGYYFVGEALRRNGNPRCRTYLLEAVRMHPLFLKGWLRLLQSLAIGRGGRGAAATGTG